MVILDHLPVPNCSPSLLLGSFAQLTPVKDLVSFHEVGGRLRKDYPRPISIILMTRAQRF